jgi:hypothetical protein
VEPQCVGEGVVFPFDRKRRRRLGARWRGGGRGGRVVSAVVSCGAALWRGLGCHAMELLLCENEKNEDRDERAVKVAPVNDF